ASASLHVAPAPADAARTQPHLRWHPWNRVEGVGVNAAQECGSDFVTHDGVVVINDHHRLDGANGLHLSLLSALGRANEREQIRKTDAGRIDIFSRKNVYSWTRRRLKSRDICRSNACNDWNGRFPSSALGKARMRN